MKQIFKFLSAAVAAMLVSLTSPAQVTTSSMSGLVTDSDARPVVGAAVVATLSESGLTYAAVTNRDGRFAINGMRPGGPYSVEISCLAYQAQVYTDLYLQLGGTLDMKAELADDAEMLAEALVISDAYSKFPAGKTGPATAISGREMGEVPTISRNITDILRLSPYGGNGMSFCGYDGRTANFTVDGANFNNNFGLDSSLPGGGNPISIDAIEELQVVIAPFDVRQSGFIGGGVNAITKSGTNRLQGSAYVYHRNENMRGDSIEHEQIPTARDVDRVTTFGATLGGPLVKNRLFFFASFEYSKIPSMPEACRWRGSSDGVGDADSHLSRCRLDDLQKISDYVKDEYGYDTGSYTSFLTDQSTMKALARIDWNINRRHKLALRYNYADNSVWDAPHKGSMDGGQRSPYQRMSLYSMAFANSLYSQNNIVHSASLDLNSSFTDRLSNQLLVTFSKLDDVRSTKSADFPFIDIQDGTGNNRQYMSLGHELFSWNNGVHNTNVLVRDELCLSAGSHRITAGLSYTYTMADNSYMRNGTGYYRFDGIDTFMAKGAPEIVCLTYGYDGEEKPAARVRRHDAAVYAQDEWYAGSRFRLTYGLRLDTGIYDSRDLMTNNAIRDIAYYPMSHGLTEQHIDTGRWPGAQVAVSPRLEFSWDVLGDRSLTLRGGTGLFQGRIPLAFLVNIPNKGGMLQYGAQINGNTVVVDDGGNVKLPFYTGPVVERDGVKYIDMNQFSGGIMNRTELREYLVSVGYPSTVTPEEGTKPSSIAGVDRKFRMPQIWKTSLALDYSFHTSFPFSVTLEGIFNKNVNAATVSDWSMKPVDEFETFRGADSRPLFPASFRTDTKAFVLENTSRGYGYSANVTVRMQPVPQLSLMAAYTRTGCMEITDMPGSDAENAFTYVPSHRSANCLSLHNSANLIPDRVVASLTYNTRCGDHFSLIYESWRGGVNYSYMVANDMNGDGYQFDALYIPTDSEVMDKEFRFVSEADRDNFMSYVHKDRYLSRHQGEYAGAHSVYNPWVHRIDFAYKHDFRFHIGRSENVLRLCADIRNVANIFSDRYGVVRVMNPSLDSGRILNFEGRDPDGYATFSTNPAVGSGTQTWVRSHDIGQCWCASVGIKYMFN